MPTIGPGAVHLMNGLYDAHFDGSPVLRITGLTSTTSTTCTARVSRKACGGEARRCDQTFLPRQTSTTFFEVDLLQGMSQHCLLPVAHECRSNRTMQLRGPANGRARHETNTVVAPVVCRRVDEALECLL
jgi:hypothetical protein